MNTKKYYTARWARPGQPSIGNVSFYARSDYHAKLQADKIERQIGLPNTPRTITRDNQTIDRTTICYKATAIARKEKGRELK